MIDQMFQRYDTDGNGELSESELPKPRDNGQRGSIDLIGPLSKLPTPISKEKFAEVLRQSIPRASAAMAPQFGGFGNRPAMASFDWVSTGSSLELSPKSESDGSVSMKVEFQSDQLGGTSASVKENPSDDAASYFSRLDTDQNGTISNAEWQASRRVRGRFEQAGISFSDMNLQQFSENWAKVIGSESSPADAAPSAVQAAPAALSSDMTTASADSVVKLIPGKVRVIQSSVSDGGSSAQTLVVFVSLVAR